MGLFYRTDFFHIKVFYFKVNCNFCSYTLMIESIYIIPLNMACLWIYVMEAQINNITT